jgi:hypothetical protein
MQPLPPMRVGPRFSADQRDLVSERLGAVRQAAERTGGAADAVRGEAERVAREADGLSRQVVAFVGEIAAA